MLPARQYYTSVCSAISSASSTSIPSYLTALSSLVWSRRSWTARRFLVRRLHRSLGLPLHHNRAGCDVTALDHVVNAMPYQVAPSQLAVDGEVEQREFPGSTIQLQSNPDGPDLFQLQGRLLAEQLALFHGIERPAVVVAVSMNSFSVEGKEPHVDPARRALADAKRTFASPKAAIQERVLTAHSFRYHRWELLRKTRLAH